MTGDATSHDFGDSIYNVIHARLVLMHLPDREAVLATLVRALRPGGRLVVSDWDCTQPERMLLRGSPDTITNFLAFQRALLGFAVSNGASLDWAQRLPRALEYAGLTEVRADVHSQMWRGGEPGALLHASNSVQLQQQLLDRGVELADLEQMRLALDDPATCLWQYPMVTAVGTRSVDA